MPELVIGIDIGGTSTKLGLVDSRGTCLATSHLPTHAQQPATHYVPRLMAALQDLMQHKEPAQQVVGIGIGAPNANYYQGTIERPPNLNWPGTTPLAEMLRTALGLPVALTNDANAAALGEMRYGVARGMRHFIVITLGTGLGSGIVTNGELVLGHDGYAGELGHTLVNWERGRSCGCGRRGCLETYVSGTGICRTVYKLLADSTDPSELRGVSFNDLSAEMITDAALRGDPIARQAFEYTGRILGLKLADAVVHLSPEAIILFGGLTRAKEILFEPTQRYMEHYMMPIFKGKVRLLSSGLQGANTAVLGAAALIWEELELSGHHLTA